MNATEINLDSTSLPHRTLGITGVFCKCPTYFKMFDKENKFSMKASTVCAAHSEFWDVISTQFFRGH